MRLNSIRRTATRQAIIVIAMMCLVIGSADSHEMWVEVSKSIVKPGTEVSLNLYVGRNLKGDVQPYNPNSFQHYNVTTATTRVPISGHFGDIPAGRVASVAEGLNIVSYHSEPMQLRFREASKWQQYLAYEGLDDVAQFYRQNDFPQQGVRETYQRCSRALIWGMPPPETSLVETAKQDRPVGMPLELIFLDNPFITTNSSETLKLRLIYLSKPIAGIQVRVFYRSANERDKVIDTTARTDQNGTVTLPRFGPGHYLFNAVHLFPAAPALQADWQSYWASLSVTLE